MNYDNTSIFETIESDKGHEEWQTFHKVQDDKVSAFKPFSPRSTYEPRYVNIVHINRYRTT